MIPTEHIIVFMNLWLLLVLVLVITYVAAAINICSFISVPFPPLNWKIKPIVIENVFHPEIASLNPDDATAMCGWRPRQQTWLCSLSGRDGIHSLSPVNHSNFGPLREILHVCGRGSSFLLGLGLAGFTCL